MSETVGRIEQLTTELKSASPFQAVEIAREVLIESATQSSTQIANLAGAEERQRCLALARHVRDDEGTFPDEAASKIVSLIEGGRTVEDLLAADKTGDPL